MNIATVSESAPVTLTSRALQAPRFEMYRAPHKALRLVLSELMLAMGRTSFADANEAGAIASALEVVLQMCDAHIAHEDAHIRPALVARTALTIATLDAEHDEHAEEVAELRSLAKALVNAEQLVMNRTEIGRTLYLHFTVFVAKTLAHMAYEERVVQSLLERNFSFDELVQLHVQLVSSIAPEEMTSWLRAMLPASSRDERVEIMEGGRKAMPPTVFAHLVAEMAELLTPADARDFTSRLGC